MAKNATAHTIDSLGQIGLEQYEYVQNKVSIYEANADFMSDAAKTLSELLKGYEALREANVIGADKWFHCLYMCRASRVGNLPKFTLFLASLREIIDLIKARFSSGVDSRSKRKISDIEQTLDSLSDMEANKVGINCPAELGCECRYAKYKVNGIQ